MPTRPRGQNFRKKSALLGAELLEDRTVPSATWQAVAVDPNPQVQSGYNFLGVWGSNPNDVYVVGNVMSNNASHTLISHFNGDAWSSIVNPPDLQDGSLAAVWGDNHGNVYAGDRLKPVTGVVELYPLIDEFHDGQWTTAPGAEQPPTFDNATGTWRADPNATVPHHLDPAINNWDTLRITSFWGSGDDVYAAGGASFDILHKHGHSIDANWVAERHPDGDRVQGMWGSDLNNIYAVGLDGILFNDSTLHNGTFWTKVWTPPNTLTTLSGVWGSGPNDVYAVGQTSSTEGVIYHSVGADLDGNWNWTRVELNLPSGAPPRLLSVWGTGSNDVYAVGAGGVILHFDGTGWTKQTSFTTGTLRGIWGSANDVYAVGLNGAIGHLQPATQTVLTLVAADAAYTGAAYSDQNLTTTVEPGSATGSVSYVFYSDAAGQNVIARPTNAGTYYVQAFFASSNHASYTDAQSGIVPFAINAKLLSVDATTQGTINIAKEGTIAFTLSITEGLIAGNNNIAALFNGAVFTIHVDGTSYSLISTATVAADGSIRVSMKMSQGLQNALLTALSEGSTVDFRLSALSSDSNYNFAADAIARLISQGKLKYVVV